MRFEHIHAPEPPGTPKAADNGRPDNGGGPVLPSVGVATDFHLTDDGNATRLLHRQGRDLRYCHPWKQWLVWDNTRWREDDTGRPAFLVKETRDDAFRILMAQLGLGGPPSAEQMVLLKHLARWEEARRVMATLELARSHPGVPVVPGELDRDGLLLNVQNGTLDLRNGRLHDHRRTDLITKVCPVAYNKDATCPLWLAFLDRVRAEDRELTDYLQRVVGYCLTGSVAEQCLWFLYGTGTNGKSTFLLTLLELLGDYGLQAVSDLLMVKNNESHPTERAALFGKRLAATIETEQGKKIAEALMKQLTGGDKILARKLYKDFFEFRPTHKLFLAVNHKPVVTGVDNAVWRRIKLVPFVVTIPDSEKDKHLPDKLRAELPGILAWAVRGCLDWQRGGLAEPKVVREATTAYQNEQDTVGGFLAACCWVRSGLRVKATVLHEAYQGWSGDLDMSRKRFGEMLREKGFNAPTHQKTGYYWQGIALKEPE
jgi:putative DNA primase/helicase